MRSSRGVQRVGRWAWVTSVILGLLHTPLPVPDFHTIRHQDAPGQVCELHHHLLRWHPGAGQDEAVAVLHWHWFVPTRGADVDRDNQSPGPIAHADADGWQADPWATTPQIVADPGPAPLALKHVVDLPPFPEGPAGSATFTPPKSRDGWSAARHGPPQRVVSLNALLQRWVC